MKAWRGLNWSSLKFTGKANKSKGSENDMMVIKMCVSIPQDKIKLKIGKLNGLFSVKYLNLSTILRSLHTISHACCKLEEVWIIKLHLGEEIFYLSIHYIWNWYSKMNLSHAWNYIRANDETREAQ